MTILEGAEPVRVEDSEKDQENSEPLIPGLPDEIAEHCLLHLPYPYHTLVRSVSSSWNRAITNPNFVLSKKTLSLSLPYIFVFAFHKSTADIQWQVLDPRSGRWFVLPPMPCVKPVCPPGFACASLPRQGALYVLGGMRSDTETSLQTLLTYRTSTNRWSLASPMLTARSFFAAGTIGGKILAVGGSGAGSEDTISTVECYDPEKDTWAPVAKMRAGLARYDAAVVGNKMYVTEGWTWPFSFSPRGGVYDAEKDTWEEISVVLGERLFVISEHGDCRVKMYVPDSDTWRYVDGGKFPCEMVQRPFAVSGAEGTIYVVARGLDVAVGRVGEDGERVWVDWELVRAPKAFHDFVPSSTQIIYA
uniref:F-box domain-containing protein n=1 Tax=Nelumbo nucifera TaxID=4432 RepID=A0A822Y173_NELNU|nr:TPA_asm: hypothetical protein HUJ06_029122 [Nelumbo nucifera]